jgi:hypothetical protein
LYTKYLTNETLEGFRGFRKGKVIRTVKYAHELVLSAKEGNKLQSIIDRITENGRLNVEKLR